MYNISFTEGITLGVTMKDIDLGKGRVSRVDDEDYIALIQFRWSAIKGMNTYYAFRESFNQARGITTMIPMHREILNVGKNSEVDHINGNGLDNRRDNLRVVPHKVNCANKHSGNNFGNPFTIRPTIPKSNVKMNAFKTTSEDLRVLAALKKAKVEKNVSDRIRAGLRALAREKGVEI